MNLLPQDDKFFGFLQEQLGIACRASTLLVSGLSQGHSELSDSVDAIRELEGEGDSVVRETIQRLQRTFLTPFEPEVVQALTKKLDDVLDTIEETGFRIKIFGLDQIPDELAEIGRIASESCHCLQNGVRLLKSRKPLVAELRKVRAFESQAHGLSRRLLSELFRIQHEPVYFLKRKEAAESLVTITEQCSDVAVILEEISWGRGGNLRTLRQLCRIGVSEK